MVFSILGPEGDCSVYTVSEKTKERRFVLIDGDLNIGLILSREVFSVYRQVLFLNEIESDLSLFEIVLRSGYHIQGCGQARDDTVRI